MCACSYMYVHKIMIIHRYNTNVMESATYNTMLVAVLAVFLQPPIASSSSCVVVTLLSLVIGVVVFTGVTLLVFCNLTSSVSKAIGKNVLFNDGLISTHYL